MTTAVLLGLVEPAFKMNLAGEVVSVILAGQGSRMCRSALSIEHHEKVIDSIWSHSDGPITLTTAISSTRPRAWRRSGRGIRDALRDESPNRASRSIA